MTPPKHLWSGDWREDSAAAAEALHRRRPKSEKQSSSEAPTEVRPRVERPVRPPETKPARAAETQPRPVAAPRPLINQAPRQAPESPRRTVQPKPREPQRRSSAPDGVDRRRGVRALVVFAISALLVAGGAIAISRALGGDDKAPALSSSSRPWLGVQMENLAVGGVTVTTVSPGGPADNAGITPGDVITEIDNQPVNTTADVNAAVSALHPGSQVEIQLQRGPITYTTEATLAASPPGTP